MKKNLILIFRVCGLLLLSLCTLLGAAFPAAADVNEDPFHYGTADGGATKTVPGDELFSLLFHESLTNAEAEYLAGNVSLGLRLHDRVPTDVVTTQYDGERGVLTLYVSPYAYTAANGIGVTWLPTRVHLGDESRPAVMEGDTYTCSFDNLLYSEDFDVTVDFSCTLALPAATVDLLLTRPWEEGSEALARIEAYEQNELAPYLAAKAKYDIYTAYLQSIKDYEQYLADLEAYEAALQLYEVYCAEYEAYAKKLSAYEAWQRYEADLAHYWAYQDFLENDLEAYSAYLTYSNQLNEVKARLNVLDALFTTDSNGWELYASLMGNTVTSVVQRRAELIAAGCDPNNIETAGKSTVVLRTLMKGYADLQGATYEGEHERLKALYAYYTQNYDALRTEYAKLYGALKALYDNEIVYMALIKEGKLEHFQQFVGQLYVTATCLDDNVTRSAAWRISKKTLAEVVEPAQLLTDTNESNPAGALFPEKEVAYVASVEPIEKPTKPTGEEDPPHPGAAPTPVAEPQKPTVVEKPDTSNPPPEASDPGAAPAFPEMSTALRALAESIRKGETPQRDARKEERTLTFESKTVCPISIHNLKTVSFYDYDGKTLLWQTRVDYAGAVSYAGPSMQRKDPQYVYEFLGWRFADGSPADYGRVTTNLSIYANYRITPRYYTVTWILDGVTKVTASLYGQTPVAPFALTKASTAACDYVFSGWDHEVSPITQNETYVGSFVAVSRQYEVVWITAQGELVQSVAYGSSLSYPQATPASYLQNGVLYTFVSWDRSLEQSVTGNLTVTARYEGKELVVATDASSVLVKESEGAVTVTAGQSSILIANALQYARSVEKELEVVWDDFTLRLNAHAIDALYSLGCERLSYLLTEGEKSYTCGVTFSDRFGNALTPSDFSATVVPCEARADGSFYAYATEDGERIELELEVHSSFLLTVRSAYRLTPEENLHCDVDSLAACAVPGDEIQLDMTCTFGYGVTGVELIAEDGSVTFVEGKKFIMPEGNVTLRLRVERIVYHVTFTVNGEVYHTADYYLGETILLPEPPVLAADDTYSYAFSRWSPSPTLAMGENTSPVFEAIFSKTLLKAEDPYKARGNNNRFLTVFLPILLGVVALVVGLLVFLRIRKKRQTEYTVRVSRLQRLRYYARRVFSRKGKD